MALDGGILFQIPDVQQVQLLGWAAKCLLRNHQINSWTPIDHLSVTLANRISVVWLYLNPKGLVCISRVIPPSSIFVPRTSGIASGTLCTLPNAAACREKLLPNLVPIND